MKIISLFPKRLYDSKMSPGRTMYLNWFGAINGFQTIWSGNGWKNYNESESVLANVERLESSNEGKCDAIIVYKGADLRDIAGCDRRRFIIFNEANSEAVVNKEIGEAAATDVVFHHNSDFEAWDPVLRRRGVRSHSWCHAAPPLTVETSWEDRIYDVIVSGCLAKSIYPLRAAASDAVAEGFFRSPHIIRHPGYRLASRWEIAKQYSRYLELLSKSEVAICCTSIYKYPLAKLFEAAMCGCCVATDLPICPQFEEIMWPHCIQLRADMTPEEVAYTISTYSNAEKKERGRKLSELAMEHFSYDRWAACLTSAIRDDC